MGSALTNELMPVQRHIKNPVREVRRPHVPSEGNLVPFNRSRMWLSGRLQAARIEGKVGPETLCNILLGCWICDSLTDSLESSFSQTIRDVGSSNSHFDRGVRWLEHVP